MNLKNKISVIVAIYKDINALDLILQSLYNQTYTGEYEVIVAEDGEDPAVETFIETLKYPNLIHAKQKDEGWRKNKSLNNAIRRSSGDLIIFVDGDCVPYDNFIENYTKQQEEKKVLCGRRVELGPKYSKKLRDKEVSMKNIQSSYLKLFGKMRKDGARHYEEGIVLNAFFHNLKYRKKESHILGCNFALNRKDLYDINGFNEEYHNPSVGEDTDIEHRLSQIGCVMKPVRNLCNVLHLHHIEKYDAQANARSRAVFEKIKKENQIVCQHGLNQSSNN